MRRFLLPACLIAVLALTLSACDASFTPYAARVDGTTISSGSLSDALQAISTDSALRCFLAASSENESGQSTVSIEGAGSGTYDASFVAAQLTALIKEVTLVQAAGGLGLHATPAALSLAASRLTEEFTAPSGSGCSASGATLLGDLAPSYRNLLINLEANQDVIAAHLAGTTLSTSGLQAYAAAHPNSTSLACVSAILLSSLAEATSARHEIVAGASFATVAKAKSLDQSSAPSGGVLGCHAVTDFAAPLDTDLEKLPTGTLSPPLKFGSQYVLLEVTARQAPTANEVLDALVNSVGTAENTLVNKASGHDQVSVDPRYGRWERSDGSWSVVPPQGPAAADLPNVAALTPPVVSLG